MKVKNVKMIEQHVEKLVLGIAVAAAVYLAYSAFTSPVTVDHNGTPVKASEVTREVSASVETLRRDLAKNSEQAQPVAIENFVEKYNAIANQPLPTDLQHGIAAFTPLNMGPPAGLSGPANPTQLAILTPVIPAPTALTAEVSRGSITSEPAAAAPGATPAPVPELKDVKDVEWVMLKASYPMSKLLQAMAAPQNRIPAEAQRYTFARVEVERQKQNPDRSWSGRWEAVPPVASVELPRIQLAANADPDTVKKVLDDLDTGWPAVLRPAFYRLVTPPLQIEEAHPVPQPAAPIRRPVAPPPPMDGGALNADNADGGTATITVAPVAPPPSVRPRPAAPKPAPAVAAAPAAAAPPVAGPPPSESLPPEQSHQALLAEENAPIWFYDEHVKGGDRYRYRMRLAIFNPLFHLDMQLKDPNAKNVPWLRSDWAVLAEPVTVTSSRQMFVVRGGLNSKLNSASFRIYRWQYGHWFYSDDAFSPGETVGKTRKPSNFTEQIDFDTGYTLIAVDTEKSGETRVVLQGPNGELITHDSMVDQVDPVRRRLDEQISKDQAPATQPATPVAGT